MKPVLKEHLGKLQSGSMDRREVMFTEANSR
jgi:hypothetical protein